MKEVKPPKKPLLYYAAICAVVLMLMNALVFPRLLSAQVREVGYSDFLTMLDEGKIDTVELADDQIIFCDNGDPVSYYKTGRIDDAKLVDRLQAKGVHFGQAITETMSPLLSFLITWIGPILIFSLIGRMMYSKMGGAGGMNADTLRQNIRRCKELTDKPFGVNIMLMHPQADEFAKIVVEEGVQVVTTGAGNPGKYVPMWKAAGIKVIPVVAAAVLAKHLEPLGIDAVIAEGTESGGHVGEMTTMALVPQVVDAVNVPVIAAGGIADGRQLAAALALGACGVQVGTCLLVSEECPIHENYKAALLKAKDSDTIVTGRIGGSPVRVLKNRMSREYVRQEKAGADKMELEKYTLGSLRRAVFEGDTTTGSLMAGQVAGMLHEVRPVADILADLWDGGRQRIAALSDEC